VELWDFYNLVGFEVFFCWLVVCVVFTICNIVELHGPFGQCKRFQSQKKDLVLYQYFQYSYNVYDKNPLMILAPLEKEEFCSGVIIGTLCLW
jgi:hypothetical protein